MIPFPLFFLFLASSEDRDFLEQLYIRHERLIYRTAGRYSRKREETQDIVQDSLVKIVRYVHRLRKLDACTQTAAVVILTKNTAINHARHLGVVRRHRSCDGWDSDWFPAPLPAGSVEQMVNRAKQKDVLNRLWPRLPEDCRILLEGKYILGLDNGELAALLGCQPDSVRMKLSRARRSALAEMKRIGYDYDPS